MTTDYPGGTMAPFVPWAKKRAIANGIDQDQTAQNAQSDLDLWRPMVKSKLCDNSLCGMKYVVFADVEIGRVYKYGAERVQLIVI